AVQARSRRAGDHHRGGGRRRRDDPRRGDRAGDEPLQHEGRAGVREGLDGAASESDLLNLALEIHLEWGPELGRPEAVRMAERTQGVDPERIEALLAEAANAASLAFGIVEEGWGDGSHSEALTVDARAAVERDHPWVDDDNMSHVLSQACYYAWHG